MHFRPKLQKFQTLVPAKNSHLKVAKQHTTQLHPHHDFLSYTHCHEYVLLVATIMKGTEVPNPRRSSACNCTCCHAHSVFLLPMHSLLKGFRFSHVLCILSRSLLVMHILFCSCLCKVCSRVSDALSQALCNFSFLTDFTLSDSTALIRDVKHNLVHRFR